MSTNPWGKPVEIPPDLRGQIRDLIYQMGPADPDGDYTSALSEDEIVRRWRLLGLNAPDTEYRRRMSTRLRNILMDTGDVSERCFKDTLFLGNGSYSGWLVRLLHDRLDHGLNWLGGSQGGPLTAVEAADTRRNLEDVVRDIAMALLGQEIVFVPKATVAPPPDPKPSPTRVRDADDDKYDFIAKLLLGKL